MAGGRGDFWVFGCGSLMWNPGFPHAEAEPALMRGYHRALCVFSHEYRGTPEVPGLVVGLDLGGSCRGIAFRVLGADREAVMAYLDEREMTNDVYAPRFVRTVLDGGRAVPAYAYIVRRDHLQYAGRQPTRRAAQLVLQGYGHRGHGLEYLENTVQHLDELGIRDGQLHEVLDAAHRLAGKG